MSHRRTAFAARFRRQVARHHAASPASRRHRLRGAGDDTYRLIN